MTRTPSEILSVPIAVDPEATTLEFVVVLVPEPVQPEETPARRTRQPRREPLAESHEWLTDTRYTP